MWIWWDCTTHPGSKSSRDPRHPVSMPTPDASHANDWNRQWFDILADEDKCEFEDLGPYDASVWHNGSSRLGASAGRLKSGRTWTSVMSQSITGSIKSVGAAVQCAISRTPGLSATGQHSLDWWEKDMEFVSYWTKTVAWVMSMLLMGMWAHQKCLSTCKMVSVLQQWVKCQGIVTHIMILLRKTQSQFLADTPPLWVG